MLQQTAKALIILCGCVGWSEAVHFPYPWRQLSESDCPSLLIAVWSAFKLFRSVLLLASRCEGGLSFEVWVPLFHICLIAAIPSEKVPSSMWEMYGFLSSCTCAKSHPGPFSPQIHSIVSNDSGSGQRAQIRQCLLSGPFAGPDQTMPLIWVFAFCAVPKKRILAWSSSHVREVFFWNVIKKTIYCLLCTDRCLGCLSENLIPSA